MPIFGVILIISGVLIIKFPDIISYIIGGLLLFVGLNMVFIKYLLSKAGKKTGESYVKFGNYKIYKD